MIYICNLAEMPGHVGRLKPTRLVSLQAPHEQPPTPQEIGKGCHLKVSVNDISQPLAGHILPEGSHIGPLIDFIGAWDPEEGPLLVHCFAGISRSTAAAMIALAVKAPGRVPELGHHLRHHAPHALPNRRMIEVADRMLDLDGRLIAAHQAMAPPTLAYSGPLTELPLF
jgi:predicted protein tyrosine phosphatase